MIKDSRLIRFALQFRRARLIGISSEHRKMIIWFNFRCFPLSESRTCPIVGVGKPQSHGLRREDGGIQH
jgi:hypothetical protein